MYLDAKLNLWLDKLSVDKLAWLLTAGIWVLVLLESNHLPLVMHKRVA